jgi:serine/threonine protein kinase
MSLGLSHTPPDGVCDNGEPRVSLLYTMGREQWAEAQPEGKHVILAELGHGGTADVYVAVARGPSGFSKLVVLKTLKASLRSDPEFRAMFLNEARLAARLSHSNIVQTYEVIEQSGVPTIVMEYLEGQPLSAILKNANKDLPLAMHLRILCDVLTGLQCAHDLVDFDGVPLEVVHRDATPQNVFVTFDGQVKLLDFGIAKLSVSNVETQQGIVKGKIRYIAPENILGQTIDRRTDIYAVGVMLWEAAAGVPLWKNQTDAAIMSAVIRGKIPSPRTLNNDVNDVLERICMKALAPNPDDRYGSAAELETELLGLLADLGANVRNRDISRMMTSTFQETRLRSRAIIDQQLRAIGSFSMADSQTRPVVSYPPVSSQSAKVQIASSRPLMDVELTEELPWNEPSASVHQSRPRTFILWGALAAAVLGWGAFWFLRGEVSRGADMHTLLVAKPPAAQAQAPGAPSDVQLHLRASPVDAMLSLDGRALPSNPFTGLVRADHAEHTLRAEAPGYVTVSRQIPLDRDAYIALTLEAFVAPGAKGSAAAPARR